MTATYASPKGNKTYADHHKMQQNTTSYQTAKKHDNFTSFNYVLKIEHVKLQ